MEFILKMLKGHSLMIDKKSVFFLGNCYINSQLISSCRVNTESLSEISLQIALPSRCLLYASICAYEEVLGAGQGDTVKEPHLDQHNFTEAISYFIEQRNSVICK